MVPSRAFLPLPLCLITTTKRRLGKLNYAQSLAFCSVADHRSPGGANCTSVLSAPTKTSSHVQATKARSRLNLPPDHSAHPSQARAINHSRSKIAMGSPQWAKGGKRSRKEQKTAKKDRENEQSRRKFFFFLKKRRNEGAEGRENGANGNNVCLFAFCIQGKLLLS